MEKAWRGMKLLHWFSHYFGWNTGTVETWYDGDTLMVGFRCDCGKLEQISRCLGIVK